MASPRVSFNDSRPPSRARSDASFTTFATALSERPASSHSVYSVSREIDHIKSLISRSHASPPSAQGSITAQVFRRRRQSSASISHTQIFQELDTLKRRIKSDRPQVERRPSQIDPGHESDADGDEDYPDEREEEIARLKEEIEHVRSQEEQLLANAEDRVDLLTSQKEDLERSLHSSTAEITNLRKEKDQLSKSLLEAETNITQLRNASSSRKAAHAQVAELQRVKASLTSSLSQLNARIAEVESIRQEEAKRSQATIDEHLVNINSIKSRLFELQGAHDAVSKLLEEAKASNAALTAQIKDGDVATANLRAENTSRRDELQRAVDEHNASIQQKDAELDAARDAHKDEHEKLKASHEDERKIWEAALTDELSKAEATHKGKVSKMEKIHAKALESIESARKSYVANLEAKHSDALQRATTEHSQALTAQREASETAATRHEKQVDELRQSHAAALEQIKQTISADSTNAAKAVHEQEIKELESSHANDLEYLLKANLKQLEDLRQHFTREAEANQKEHEIELSENNVQWETKLAALTDTHAQDRNGIESEWITKVADLKAQHQKEREVIETEWEEKLSELSARHETAQDEARSSGSNAHAAQLEQLKTQHAEALSRAVTDAKAELIEQKAITHKNELNQLRETLHSEITTLQTQLQQRSAAHDAELKKLETSSQEQSTVLEQQNAEFAAQTEQHKAEVSSIQARLDAALTGQAEAERALAAQRHALSDEHKRLSLNNKSLEESVTRLKEENHQLAEQCNQTERSYKKLKRASTMAAASQDELEQLAALRLQLANETHERQEAQIALADAQKARVEITRQNEFLVQRLQVLQQALTQRSPSKRPETPDNAIQSAQAEEDLGVPEPKTDLRAVRPLMVETYRPKSLRPETPLSPNKREAKEEIDRAWKDQSFEDYLDNAQAELSELGTTINANEALFARKMQEHVGDLQRAKDVLAAEYKSKVEKLSSERTRMEQTISIKQAVDFAEERRALIASYGAELDRVSGEADHRNLSHHRAQALRNAEQRLVKEYNRRVARRTSELALRHAAEFQNLTLDYDRRMAELLNNRYSADSGINIDRDQLEKDLDDLDARLDAEVEENLNLHANNYTHRPASSTPNSRLDDFDFGPDLMPSPTPSISKTSAPRTLSSLPRAVPQYVSNRNSPYATSQPLGVRRAQTTVDARRASSIARTSSEHSQRAISPDLSRSSTSRATPTRGIMNLPMSPLSAHPPISASDHTRITSGSDLQGSPPPPPPPPSDTKPQQSQPPLTPRTLSPAGSQTRVPTAAEVFEQHAQEQRASLEAARPGFLKRTRDRLQHRKSMKLSSAMIYDVAPVTPSPPAVKSMAVPHPPPPPRTTSLPTRQQSATAV